MFKRFWKAIQKPRLYVAVIFVILFGVSLALTIYLFYINSLIAAYILTAVTVCVFSYGIYALISVGMRLRPSFLAWAEKHPIVKRAVEDYDFRTIVFSIFWLVISLGYAIFNGVYGIVIGWNAWYLSLAVYYAMLSVMRAVLAGRGVRANVRLDKRKAEESQIRSYRVTGYMLLVLTAALIFMFWMLILDPSEDLRRYTGALLIVSGIYMGVKLVLAVTNFVRAAGRRHDKITHALRSVNLADALVSTLTFLVALLIRTGFDTTASSMTVRVMGTIICGFVVVLALVMIFNSMASMHKLKKAEAFDSLGHVFKNTEKGWSEYGFDDEDEEDDDEEYVIPERNPTEDDEDEIGYWNTKR